MVALDYDGFVTRSNDFTVPASANHDDEHYLMLVRRCIIRIDRETFTLAERFERTNDLIKRATQS